MYFKLLLFIFAIFVALRATSSNETADFFPDVKENLTAITWAHAVNSQELLEAALKDSVMMLEADVVIGHLNDDSTLIPIMAHPPSTTSDLSLQDFMQKVQEFNVNTTDKKGIKLDFKTIDAVEKSSSILDETYSKMSYPLWLNADILPGPFNTTDPPVDPDRFVRAVQKYKNATLSIGWKTLYGGDIINASYTDDQINKMIEFIQQRNITQAITFPVRAGIAAQSIDQLEKILNNVTDSTLTLWDGNGDYVEIEPLKQLVHQVGLNKVYVDLPEDLKNKLELDEPAGVNNLKPFAILSIVLLALAKLV